MFFIDYWYYILVVPALILSLLASANVKSTFAKYSATPSAGGMTGADSARRILDENGLYDVRIEPVSGELTDHYDPRSNTIRLSESVYGAQTAAAVGVAAHEAGHAVQYATGYFPIKLRAAMIPVTQIGSNLAMPLVLLGLLLGFEQLAMAGVIAFSLATLFQLVTLPVEFNASARAVRSLEGSGRMDEAQMRGTRRVLTAAALTYVAALALSLANLLRLFLLVGGRDRRR